MLNVIFIIAQDLTDTQCFDISPTLIRGIMVYVEKRNTSLNKNDFGKG